MKKYITRVSQVYSAKNKLEKAIQEFIKTNDRLLIDGKDLSQFKNQIIQHINFLNEEHRRCSSKRSSWFNSSSDSKIKDFGLGGIECIAFYIHEVNKEYSSENAL